MRITETERRVLRDEAQNSFWGRLQGFSFRVRVDDARRGGDIDLLVETAKMGHAAIFEAQLNFLARVKLALGERKIDVLVDYPDRKDHPKILRLAQAHGVQL